MSQFFKKNRLLLMHLFFWALYFSFFFYRVTPRRRDEDLFFPSLLDAIFQVILLAGISYFNYFILLTRYLKHKKPLQYLFELIISLVFIVYIQRQIKMEIYENVFPESIRFFNSSYYYIQHTLIIIFVMAFISMLRFANDWFELEAKRKEVENMKLNAELKFLKEQVNPHFLFNTLNNLYYLAISKSTKTPEVISELSQMMRYMIYDSNQESVPVSKEIEYIENYISLEKLRLEESVSIELEITGDAGVLRVTPYVFITFLENAFKHGLSPDIENAWIKIKLSFDGNRCHYIVKNSIPKSSGFEGKPGIGLNNVKRRLNLLYANKHTLNIDQSEDSYSVDLLIEL